MYVKALLLLAVIALFFFVAVFMVCARLCTHV